MHISYTAHNPEKSSSSCSNLIEYLDKENQIENNRDEIKARESFFNSEYDVINSDLDLNTSDIINELDNNRGSQKLSSSNYYMINISPSFDEIKHMEKVAEEELKKRGLSNNNYGTNMIVFNEQKDELMKMQLKLYTKNLMNEYAINMNREIYIDESKLPNDKQKKELESNTNKIFNEYLLEKGITTEEIKKETKSNNWIQVNSLSVIEQKEKVSLVEIELENKNKGQVFLPSKMIQNNNGKIMIPENLFKQKEKEINDKNTKVELKEYAVTKNDITLKGVEESVVRFEKRDKNFKNTVVFFINEKDLTVANGNYQTTAHLYNQKRTAAINKNIDKEYGAAKAKIYSDLAQAKGFDLSKRKLIGDDLLWYGKVEKTRSYKHTDKSVAHNKGIISQIKKLEKGNDDSKIKGLTQQLLKDKYTNEIIKEGNIKGGDQHHIHVVVSRHDKTMRNPRNKISLSPLANAKSSKMQNGAQVGFDRTAFALKAESLFDKKFEYNRDPNKTFQKYNEGVKSNRGQSEAKHFLMNHTGINMIKQNLLPFQSIKNEIGIANIPTKLPTNVRDIAYKLAKQILSKGIEY